MSEFSMWGPEQSGVRLAEKDQDANVMNRLAQMKTAGEIQMQPMDMALKEAHAKLYGAEADEKIVNLQVRRSVMEALANRKPGEGGTQADPGEELRRLGQLHLERGDFKTGRELYTASGAYDLRMSRIDKEDATTEHTLLTTAREQSDFRSKISGAVVDQSSYQRALVTLAETGIDISGFPQNYEEAKPQLDQWAKQGLTEYQRLQNLIAQRRVKREETSESRRAGMVASGNSLRETQRQLAQERLDQLRKNGGLKPAKAPNENQIRVAAAFIKGQRVGETIEKNDLANGAATLAGDALAITLRHPGIPYPTALAQAYDPKDWQVDKPASWLEGILKQPSGTKFNPAGRSRSTPLPLPADVKSRRPGKFYETPNGVYQWGMEGGKSGWLDPGDGGGDDDDEDNI